MPCLALFPLCRRCSEALLPRHDHILILKMGLGAIDPDDEGLLDPAALSPAKKS